MSQTFNGVYDVLIVISEIVENEVMIAFALFLTKLSSLQASPIRSDYEIISTSSTADLSVSCSDNHLARCEYIFNRTHISSTPSTWQSNSILHATSSHIPSPHSPITHPPSKTTFRIRLAISTIIGTAQITTSQQRPKHGHMYATYTEPKIHQYPYSFPCLMGRHDTFSR